MIAIGFLHVCCVETARDHNIQKVYFTAWLAENHISYQVVVSDLLTIVKMGDEQGKIEKKFQI